METWPHDSLPEMRSFHLRAKNISALSGLTDELIPGGLVVQRWIAELTMPDLDEERWREHDGLFAALGGTGGLIRLFDPARGQPMYNELVARAQASWDDDALWDGGASWMSGPLPPYVSVAVSASRGATSLVLKGFPASINGVLRRGDLFEAEPNGVKAEHGHLYDVTRWAKSNADGECRVSFKPGLRKGLRIGDRIVIGGEGIRPTSVFRLASDDAGKIEVRGPMIGNFGASFVEVLPHV